MNSGNMCSMPNQGQTPNQAVIGQPGVQGQTACIPPQNGSVNGQMNSFWPQGFANPMTPMPNWGPQPVQWIPFWNGSLPTIPQGWTQGTGRPRHWKQPKKLHKKAEPKKVSVSANKVAPKPKGSVKRPATVVISDDDMPTRSNAKRSKATSKGVTPNSLDGRKRPIPPPAEKPKMFKDEEWKMHKKLADIAYRLVQMDFHIKAWKSNLIASVEERRNAYFDALKPPMMDEAFKNRLERIRQRLTVESNEVMLEHMIAKHNELVAELRSFTPLCSVKAHILDKAHRMYWLNKHERWDTATFRRLMSNVRDFCVAKQECVIVKEYELPHEPASLVETPGDIPEEVHILSQEEVLEQIEVPMRDLSCTPAGTGKAPRRVLIEEINTPTPIIAPSQRPAQIVIDEIEDTASPPSNTEMEDPISSASPDTGDLPRDAEKTVSTLFNSIEYIVNGSLFKMPELKKFIRILCNIALRDGDVIIPQQLSQILGPEITETLAHCATIPSSLTNRDLESASEVIASTLSQPDFVNTPKLHRKRKIHAALSKAFGRETWWRNVESSFPFLRKKPPHSTP